MEDKDWMRVAHVNMSQSGASCPQGLLTEDAGLILDRMLMVVPHYIVTSVWPATDTSLVQLMLHPYKLTLTWGW